MTADEQRQSEIDEAWRMHRSSDWEGRYLMLAALRQRVSSEQNHRCCYCGKRTEEGNHRRSATLEHVVPRSLGGSDHYDNVVMACGGCNSNRRADIDREDVREALKHMGLTALRVRPKQETPT